MVSFSFVHLCYVMTPCLFLFGASSHPYIFLHFEKIGFPLVYIATELAYVHKGSKTHCEYALMVSFRVCSGRIDHLCYSMCLYVQTFNARNVTAEKCAG